LFENFPGTAKRLIASENSPPNFAKTPKIFSASLE
jgi:hypothetical protein